MIRADFQSGRYNHNENTCLIFYFVGEDPANLKIMVDKAVLIKAGNRGYGNIFNDIRLNLDLAAYGNGMFLHTEEYEQVGENYHASISDGNCTREYYSEYYAYEGHLLNSGATTLETITKLIGDAVEIYSGTFALSSEEIAALAESVLFQYAENGFSGEGFDIGICHFDIIERDGKEVFEMIFESRTEGYAVSEPKADMSTRVPLKL